MNTTPLKPFSIAFGSNKPKQPPPPAQTKKRPHSALTDADSDHDEVSQPQAVTGFDQSVGGAISTAAAPANGPLVIPSLKNRDWREESRRKRGRNLLPAEVQATRNGANGFQLSETAERDEISLEAGLKLVTRDLEGDLAMLNGDTSTNAATIVESRPEQTADEEALEALLGKERKSTLVIPATDSTYDNGTTNGQTVPEDYLNEDDRFKADVASRPDVATLDAYERIPVEDFGSAMLRGMGWKEGQVIGKIGEKAGKPRTVERRPALLGIGAKETPGGVGDELGAWGKVTKGRRKTELTYNPVLLKNAQTGEMLTEEELETKKLEVKKAKEDEDWRDRRDRNLNVDKEKRRERLAINNSRSDGHRRKDRSTSPDRRKYSDSRRETSRSRERSRHGSSRRERSKSRERKHRRRDDGGYARRDRDHEYERGDRDYRR